jgi:diguanylate cyclase (GGDEF)-like protein/PAS domain S-box-containing protein
MRRRLDKKSLLLLTCWCLAGAVLVVAATFLGRTLHDLPMALQQLWLPIMFGGLAGLLFGRADLRTRELSLSLEVSEQRFQQHYRKTPAMVHSMDSKGRLLFVSQPWLDTLGYKPEEVIGRDFFDLVVGGDIPAIRAAHYGKLGVADEISDTVYQLRQADGNVIEVSVSEVALRDHDGRLTESLAVLKELTGHPAAEQSIEQLAYFDPLTGLPNRTLMHDRILQAIAMARRENRQLGLFFFDLDRFKLINDTQGHAVGDLVLRSVAQRLKKLIRKGDTFARLGGDEFVIVQADPNHDPNFTIMGRRILETLGQPLQIGDREFFTTASIGVSIYPIDGEDPQALLKSADTAMYVAKSRGRNNLQFFSNEMNSAALAKTELECRLRQALSSGQLLLHYQPLVNLETGRVTGVEALLRCYDSDGQMISPERIISVAEESGLVFPLGEWVMRTACAQARAWQEAGLPPIRMSVNLSGHHIRQTNFIDRLETILNDTGMEPAALEIELAENSIMGHVEDSIIALTDLKVRGIGLAIDDFGTGYSSLLYLKHFPIHRIKIAREFIRDVTRNRGYAAITEAILSMAGSLNLQVTAVGVENTMQLEFLRKRKCLEVQGQLFGSAMSAAEMTQFLQTRGVVIHEGKVPEGEGIYHSAGSRKIH